MLEGERIPKGAWFYWESEVGVLLIELLRSSTLYGREVAFARVRYEPASWAG